MSGNPIELFVGLFVVAFTILGLLNFLGLWSASYGAASTGNTTQLAAVWTQGIYGLIVDAIVDAIISLVVSLVVTIIALIAGGIDSSSPGSYL